MAQNDTTTFQNGNKTYPDKKNIKKTKLNEIGSIPIQNLSKKFKNSTRIYKITAFI